FSSRRRHTRLQGDWSSDVCSSDLLAVRRGKIVQSRGPCPGCLRDDCRRGPMMLLAVEKVFVSMLVGIKSSRLMAGTPGGLQGGRSEERRVGKECRSGGVEIIGRED